MLLSPISIIILMEFRIFLWKILVKIEFSQLVNTLLTLCKLRMWFGSQMVYINLIYIKVGLIMERVLYNTVSFLQGSFIWILVVGSCNREGPCIRARTVPKFVTSWIWFFKTLFLAFEIVPRPVEQIAPKVRVWVK